MNLSAPFINRPVATSLLTLGITLLGVVAFRLLPVAPLPQVDFPTLVVSASFPGASPETMAATIATPLERSLGTIAGVTELTSTSSLGSTRVTLQFDLSRDIDGAAREVQAAINAARSQLPSGMPSLPTYRKFNPSDAPVMVLALTSNVQSRGQMYDVASTVLAQKLAQVQGIGQVSVVGGSLPAVRVELNPTALNKYGISTETVRTAIAANNSRSALGAVETDDRHWQIYANDQASQAADYQSMVIAWRNNAPVRLSDIAEVVDSVENVRNAGFANGTPSVIIQLTRQPGANIIETIARVNAVLPQLRASLPAAVDMKVLMERTRTIQASLHEVERALVISTALVIMVVFIFLRNARATLIPAVAVPVSLIATFGVMYLCGFSLNNLTLMALVVATGFVVDDAVVVLENIMRHIEGGMAPRAAALRGAREVAFTVLSMSISLVAVFIPILFMGGIVGRLFREFAVTLSVTIAVSLLVSLTTTPMMCAWLLKHVDVKARPPGRLARFAENTFNDLLRLYEKTLRWALQHGRFMMVLLAATIGLNFYLYTVVPKGFFPQQDTGLMIGGIIGDQSVSFQAMRDKMITFSDIVRKDPAVATTSVSIGSSGGPGGGSNSASMFVTLKPLEERKDSSDTVQARLRKNTAHIAGANLYLQPIQDLRVGGRQGNAQFQYTLQADTLDELKEWEPRIRQAMSTLPEITDVSTDQQDKGQQVSLVIDRPAAARLGLTPQLIDAALSDIFSQRQVSTIYNARNQYHVVMEAAPQYWQNPDMLERIYVATPSGTQVPFSAFSRYEFTNAPLSVAHQGLFPATTISFNLAPGAALGDATRAIENAIVRSGAPATVIGGFAGTANAFLASVKNQPWLILAALLTVYIVLGMLYESYIHPLTILSTLPSAGVGALLALLICRSEFSIIALIGVILLIGIVKKNAILMIDFALETERRHGTPPHEAIFEACLLRFRPILMTTLAAALGALPLAVGFGEGSELRQPLGISIVGGLIFSQLLTLYTTPVVYLYLDRFRWWCLRKWRARFGPDIGANVPPEPETEGVAS
jgi:multidrug efflux pump